MNDNVSSPSNTHSAVVESRDEVEITKEDVARMIRSIAYRKSYNARPDVREGRKEYGRKRAAKMAAVREWIKRNPEVVL